MTELLIVIIAACRISSADAASWRVDNTQQKCQKELVECLSKSKKGTDGAVELAICIKDRK